MSLPSRRGFCRGVFTAWRGPEGMVELIARRRGLPVRFSGAVMGGASFAPAIHLRTGMRLQGTEPADTDASRR